MMGSVPCTPRALALVWLSAIGLAGTTVTSLLLITPLPAVPPLPTFQPPPFAVIAGTSLVKRAFPADYSAAAFFPDAAPDDRIVRLAPSNQPNGGVVALLHRAANRGVRKVLVEVDPLLRTMRSQEPSRITVLSGRLRYAALYAIEKVTGFAIEDVTGFPKTATDEPILLVFNGDKRALAARSYGASVHSPRDPAALRAALAEAKRRGTEVLWIAMPRSQAAAEVLGIGFETAFARELDGFARRFSAVVWRPAKFWPNELFIDQAHMNENGRARFIGELSRFLSPHR